MQPSQLPLVQRRPPRRSFIAGAGAVAGAPVLTLLPGRGSGDDDPDSVWDEGGAATAIVSALGAVSQGAFPARDFAVTSYGAQPCQVVAAVSPYTDASKSPVTTGSDETHVHNSFDSRPAFLTAIQACNAASALYDTTVADRR